MGDRFGCGLSWPIISKSRDEARSAWFIACPLLAYSVEKLTAPESELNFPLAMFATVRFWIYGRLPRAQKSIVASIDVAANPAHRVLQQNRPKADALPIRIREPLSSSTRSGPAK